MELISSTEMEVCLGKIRAMRRVELGMVEIPGTLYYGVVCAARISVMAQSQKFWWNLF